MTSAAGVLGGGVLAGGAELDRLAISATDIAGLQTWCWSTE
jgi:hypothetical protein